MNAEILDSAIKQAKLGRYRREAQVDTCAVFAAALYDALQALDVPCTMVTALNKTGNRWAHALVQVGDRYFDSMGEFSTAIYHKRAKIHPKVTLDISYTEDTRDECYEPEFDEMHAFYLKHLTKSLAAVAAVTN